MIIQGRAVEAVKYKEDLSTVTAHVKQIELDCRRKREPNYQCIDNCEGSIVVARFQDKQPISIKALVPIYLSLHPEIPGREGITDIEDLEALARTPGYSLNDDRKGKKLMFNGQHVGSYNPCGFSMNNQEFSQEISGIISELIHRVDEVYEVAVEKSFASTVVEDAAMASNINDPKLKLLMSMITGKKGLDLVEFLKSLNNDKN